jgi:hypothetical protein
MHSVRRTPFLQWLGAVRGFGLSGKQKGRPEAAVIVAKFANPELT